MEPNTFQIEFRNVSNKKDYWQRVWQVEAFAKSLGMRVSGRRKVEE